VPSTFGVTRRGRYTPATSMVAVGQSALWQTGSTVVPLAEYFSDGRLRL